MPMPLKLWRERWARAERAAAALREALEALGIPRAAYGGIRSAVTHSGRVYVHVGLLREDAALAVAEALGVKPPDPPGGADTA
ncbi:hypothetical protein [Streptomyces thermolilacinus]|uniref:hypothetical protein n=1 Tax=Streptomyces thermolilacinus TaxID=285540 RepID=UPI0033CFD4FB